MQVKYQSVVSNIIFLTIPTIVHNFYFLILIAYMKCVDFCNIYRSPTIKSRRLCNEMFGDSFLHSYILRFNTSPVF